MSLIFDKIDNLHLKIGKFDLMSVLQPDGWRKYSLLIVLFSGICWIILGYESCFDQLEIGTPLLLNYIMSKNSFTDVTTAMQSRYGIATHFSAFVIYGLMFYMLSKYYETKLNIKGSLNLIMSVFLVLFSISIFEFSWMTSYYYAQHQYWVLVPLTKQASILYQNLIFLIAGILTILFIVVSPWKFRRNKTFLFLFCLSLGVWALWYFYPFPTTQLTVQLETGEVWKSYPNFPQTLYTTDLNPTDNFGYGVPFFVENSLLHTVNLGMKVIWTYTIFYWAKLELKHK